MGDVADATDMGILLLALMTLWLSIFRALLQTHSP